MLQLGRICGEDELYVPLKSRKNQCKLQRQQQLSHGSTKKNTAASDNGESEEDCVGCKRCESAGTISIDKPRRDPSLVYHSNFDRFLESTTPSVLAQYLSKTSVRGFRTCDVEFQPYFTLSDLWESLEEWSAYGAGVPLFLDGRDCVVHQYYVPYLSGIQLYGLAKDSNSKPRLGGEDSDSDYCRDSSTSSEGSSDYETEKGVKFSRNLNNSSSGSSMSDEQSSGQEGFSSENDGNSRGSLLFEFLERDPPYIREPLIDKITDLTRQFPALKTLRSCDLLPLSWVSVAWYPIYRIPNGATIKDIDACFLTYHSLSTPTEGGGAQSPVMVYPSGKDIMPKIRLPVFGMATYKMKGSIWTHNGVSDRQMASSLMKAADNWLRLVGVHHPDFHFFASHMMCSR